jgi:hypothetical protein
LGAPPPRPPARPPPPPPPLSLITRQLVARSLADYEDIAVRLARDWARHAGCVCVCVCACVCARACVCVRARARLHAGKAGR